MIWRGEERRSGSERRLAERRRTMPYDVQRLLIINGITWIDPEAVQRRQRVRRQADRHSLAIKFVEHARP
jgi:hypothetical protein